MIEPRELRVGNLATSARGDVSILAIGQWDYRFKFLDRNTFDDCTHSDLSPITLTAEWLERFGFHLTLSNAVEHTESGFTIYADDEEGQDLKYYFLTDNSGTVWIDHIHQLQNLFYCLTGTELELKP